MNQLSVMTKLCSFVLFLLVSLTIAAQQTLNIHTKTKGVVSFAFADKPEVTFPSADSLTVASTTLTVHFPYAEVEKITFTDSADAVESLVVRDDTNQVLIYDLTGKLVLQARANKGRVRVDLSTLRPGVYVVKDGKRTYKVRKVC